MNKWLTPNTVKRVVQGGNAYVSVVAMVTVLIMMLLTTGDVIGRSFFGHPITGSYELTQYMLVVAVVLGIAYTQQVGGHVRIPLFVSRLCPRDQLIIDSLVTVLSLFLFSLIVWQGCRETLISFRGGGVSDLLRIPEWPFRLLIPVGVFLLSLELLMKMITLVGGLRKRRHGKGSHNEPN